MLESPIVVVGPPDYTADQLERLEGKIKSTLAQWGYSEVLVLPHGAYAFHLREK